MFGGVVNISANDASVTRHYTYSVFKDLGQQVRTMNITLSYDLPRIDTCLYLRVLTSSARLTPVAFFYLDPLTIRIIILMKLSIDSAVVIKARVIDGVNPFGI